MGSNKTQAVALLLLLISFTLLGVAFAGGGIPVGLVAIVPMVAASYFFMKCKPLEHHHG